MPYPVARLIKLSVIAAALVAIIAPALPAKADAIFSVKAASNGDTHVDLSSIIAGTWTVPIVDGSPSSGNIDVINSGTIDSFTVVYTGTTGTDAGSTIRCQNFSFPGGSTTCSVYDPVNTTTYSNGAKTPANLTLASYIVTFDFAGSGITGDFDFSWASLSGSNDTGCIAGVATTQSCGTVTTTPEPSGLILLGSALLGMAGIARRRFV